MADLNFNCPKCEQNLTTDESLSGSKIDCPSCNTPFEVPSAGDENVERTEAEPEPPVTAEPEPKKLAVPVHQGGEELLKKSSLTQGGGDQRRRKNLRQDHQARRLHRAGAGQVRRGGQQVPREVLPRADHQRTRPELLALRSHNPKIPSRLRHANCVRAVGKSLFKTRTAS